MPDQNNPTDTSITPTQVNPPSEPTQMPTTPPAPMDIPVSDASIPPPFPPESSPMEAAAPPADSGSAAPSFDIPPVVTPGQPKKKFGGKRVIATILGLLVLVGGLGAGVILVRQQQDIREKAAIPEPCNVCIGGKCIKDASPPDCMASYNQCSNPGGSCGGGGVCTPNSQRNCTTSLGCPGKEGCTSSGQWDGRCFDIADNCPAGPEAKVLPDCPSTDCNLPTKPVGSIECKLANKATVCCPTDKPLYQNGQCVTSGGTTACTRIPTTTRQTGDTLTITQEDLNKCKQYCPDGQLFAARYKCDGIKLSAGCQDNGESLDASVGKSYPVGTLTCGTVQIDVGCKNASNTWGSVKFLSKSAATACAAPPPPGEGPTAQCLDIKAFDTNWVKITDLSILKAGDKVRFSVAGTATGGSFDKARFKINGVQRPEVTGKRPATEEYFDEYTIPEGITTFSIGAQIHHTTLGWSN